MGMLLLIVIMIIIIAIYVTTSKDTAPKKDQCKKIGLNWSFIKKLIILLRNVLTKNNRV